MDTPENNPRPHLWWLPWRIRLQYYLLRGNLRVRSEKLKLAIARRVPRWLAYWVVIVVWAHGTSGKWGNTNVNDLTWDEALKRWEGRSQADAVHHS